MAVYVVHPHAATAGLHLRYFHASALLLQVAENDDRFALMIINIGLRSV